MILISVLWIEWAICLVWVPPFHIHWYHESQCLVERKTRERGNVINCDYWYDIKAFFTCLWQQFFVIFLSLLCPLYFLSYQALTDFERFPWLQVRIVSFLIHLGLLLHQLLISLLVPIFLTVEKILELFWSRNCFLQIIIQHGVDQWPTH